MAPGLELLAPALSGRSVGAGLSATWRGAPPPLVVTLFVLAGIAALLSVLTSQGNS